MIQRGFVKGHSLRDSPVYLNKQNSIKPQRFVGGKYGNSLWRQSNKTLSAPECECGGFLCDYLKKKCCNFLVGVRVYCYLAHCLIIDNCLMVQETPEQKCTLYKLKEAADLTSLTALCFIHSSHGTPSPLNFLLDLIKLSPKLGTADFLACT